MTVTGRQRQRCRIWAWVALLALLANVASPLLMLCQANAVLPGLAVEDGVICSAHGGGLPDAPVKAETKDCQCPFCCAPDDGHMVLPVQPGTATQVFRRLVLLLPDLALGAQPRAVDLANAARAPPFTLHTA